MNKSDRTLLHDLEWDIPPDRDLWPEIAAQLQHQQEANNADKAARWSVPHTWMPTAMAACLMLALTSLGVSYYSVQRNAQIAERTDQYLEFQAAILAQHQATINAMEAQQQEVRLHLAAILSDDASGLNPRLVADARAVLVTTATASAQIKAAIEHSPDQSTYLKLMASTYQREADLLKRIKLGQELAI